MKKYFENPMYPRDVVLSFLERRIEWVGLNRRLAECEPDYEEPEKQKSNCKNCKPFSY